MKYKFFLLLLILNGSLWAQDKDFFDVQPSLKTWVEERVSNSKSGKNELVELPMAVRTRAWGCRCPFHYIGVSTSTREGPWIMPISPKGFPVSDEDGYSLIVKGYFTGKTMVKDYRKNEKEPKSWVYNLPEFKIISWRKNKLEYDAIPRKVLK